MPTLIRPEVGKLAAGTLFAPGQSNDAGGIADGLVDGVARQFALLAIPEIPQQRTPDISRSFAFYLVTY